jgi:hypothetical protein
VYITHPCFLRPREVVEKTSETTEGLNGSVISTTGLLSPYIAKDQNKLSIAASPSMDS